MTSTKRLLFTIAGMVCWVLSFGDVVQTQTSLDPEELDARVNQLSRAGKIREAIPLAEEALAIRERTKHADHPDIARNVSTLASLYEAGGSPTEAELFLRRRL